MTIDKKVEEGKLTVSIGGDLNTLAAPDFEAAVREHLDAVDAVLIDMKELNYIASSGLRVLLAIQKAMNEKDGSMELCHVGEDIMEVFEITGFTGFLTILQD